MKALGPYQGKKTSLRLLMEKDLPLTLMWRNQDRSRTAFRDDRHITWPRHLAWFRQYLDKEDDLVFVIEEKTSRRPVGQASIYHIDRANGEAEFGRLLIGEKWALRHGYATEAIEVLGEVARGLGVHRLVLEVRETNAAAIGLYLKCSFVVSGREDGWVRMVRDGAPT